MTPRHDHHVRLAELIAAISLATDLGTGQPMEHALRTCHLAMGLSRELQLPAQDLFDTYYLSLLRFLGCTAESSDDAAFNGGDDIALYAGLAPSFMGAPSESRGWMLRRLAEGNPAMTRLCTRGNVATISSRCRRDPGRAVGVRGLVPWRGGRSAAHAPSAGRCPGRSRERSPRSVRPDGRDGHAGGSFKKCYLSSR